MSAASPWARAGGEAGVRAILERFYALVFADPMIGFYFRRSDRARLVERELELMSEVLGGPLAYRGRTLEAAHRAHQIPSGHFDRRTRLLERAMDAAGLDAEVRAIWLTHNAGERAHVVADPSGACEGDR